MLKKNNNKILIIGGDSTIGNEFYNINKSHFNKIHKTTKKKVLFF